MIKRKNILKIAIDSPAAAGAGTLAKAISNVLDNDASLMFYFTDTKKADNCQPFLYFERVILRGNSIPMKIIDINSHLFTIK